MKNIVLINACVRPESRTYALAKHVLSGMEGIVEEVNLERTEIQSLNWEDLQERDRYVRAKDFSAPLFRYAKQFAVADEIVLAAPYWDLSFPATLKLYFEAVTVRGLSFDYTPEGHPKGLCKARRIIYVTTAGGPILEYNLGYDYVKALAQLFYGIPEVLCYKAENLDIIGADVNGIMKKAMAGIDRGQNIL